MTVVLGIDTATRVSTGISRAGQPVAERHVDSATQHVEELTPMIEAALADAGIGFGDLQEVVVGMGPGPFTGLRVGIVTGQVIAATLGIPLRRVGTLDALARQYRRTGEYVVATDARRKELYWAKYHGGLRVGEPQVGAPTDLPDLPVVGPGALLFPGVIGDRAVAETTGALDASIMAAVSPELPAVGPEPLYLRRPDATVSTKRKSALVGKLREARP